MNQSKSLTPEDLIREDVLALKAYHVPDASGLIKLDAMENPYQWPDELQQQWLARLQQAELNRYPDPQCQSLAAQIKQSFDLDDSLEVLLGNGSDEIIHLLISAIAKPGASVLSFDPSFVMYEYISKFNQVDYIKLALNPDFQIDIKATLATIEERQPSLIFIAYPNNPTGNLFIDRQIHQIIEAANGLVVLDEAYTAFAKKSYVDEILQHDNVLVLRTLSKMGLAGLRLGFLIGRKKWIAQFDKIRLPYNINILTQVTAQFALENKAVLDEQTDQICAAREQLYRDLSAIDSLIVYPSQANFILFRINQADANQVHQRLLKHKVLIKNLAKAGPALENCLRVSVGTDAENEAFLEALKHALA